MIGLRATHDSTADIDDIMRIYDYKIHDNKKKSCSYDVPGPKLYRLSSQSSPT